MTHADPQAGGWQQQYLQSPQQPYGQQQPAWPPPQPGKKFGALKWVGLILAVMLTLLGGLFVVQKLRQHESSSDSYTTSTDKLYDDIEKAIREKDESAFLAKFKGEKTKSVQRKLFRNLIKVPFVKARFEGATQFDRFGWNEMVFVHQIKGVDVHPVYERYRWKLAQKHVDAPWHVTGVGAGSKEIEGTLGAPNYPAPWDYYDDMTVVRDGSTTVVSDRNNAATAKRAAPHISQGDRIRSALWDRNKPVGRLPLAKGSFVVLESDEKTYRALYGGGGNKWEAGHAMGMAAYDPLNDETKLEWGGSRIQMRPGPALAPHAWKQRMQELSLHEGTHAMFNSLRSEKHVASSMLGPAGADTWIVEGFAEYIELRDNRARHNAQLAQLRGYPLGLVSLPLLEHDEFYEGRRDRSAHYALSASAIFYMVEKYGERRAFEFVVKSYEEPTRTRMHYRNVLGVEARSFWDDWERYVRTKSPGIGR